MRKQPTYNANVNKDLIHPTLVKVIEKSKIAFEGKFPHLQVRVLEGHRSKELQAARFAQGRATLPVVNQLRKLAGEPPLTSNKQNFRVTFLEAGKSKHERRPSEAFDVGIFDAQTGAYYTDNKDGYYTEYAKVAGSFYPALKWGGNFKDRKGRPFIDAPHFEL